MTIVQSSDGKEREMACPLLRRLRDAGSRFCVEMISMQMPGDEHVRDVTANRDGFVFEDLKLM